MNERNYLTNSNKRIVDAYENVSQPFSQFNKGIELPAFKQFDEHLGSIETPQNDRIFQL